MTAISANVMLIAIFNTIDVSTAISLASIYVDQRNLVQGAQQVTSARLCHRLGWQILGKLTPSNHWWGYESEGSCTLKEEGLGCRAVAAVIYAEG